MSILCKLGWHSWVQVARWGWVQQGRPTQNFNCRTRRVSYAVERAQGWRASGHKCRRCGVRK